MVALRVQALGNLRDFASLTPMLLWQRVIWASALQQFKPHRTILRKVWPKFGLLSAYVNHTFLPRILRKGVVSSRD